MSRFSISSSSFLTAGAIILVVLFLWHAAGIHHEHPRFFEGSNFVMSCHGTDRYWFLMLLIGLAACCMAIPETTPGRSFHARIVSLFEHIGLPPRFALFEALRVGVIHPKIF